MEVAIRWAMVMPTVTDTILTTIIPIIATTSVPTTATTVAATTITTIILIITAITTVLTTIVITTVLTTVVITIATDDSFVSQQSTARHRQDDQKTREVQRKPHRARPAPSAIAERRGTDFDF